MNSVNQEALAGNVSAFCIERELVVLRRRMTVHNRAESTIINYSRSLRKLHDFLEIDLRLVEIDQLMDYLSHLKTDQELNWRTIKLNVAGFRYYYQEIVMDEELAQQIPYPKEKPTLPQVLSRQELKQLFDAFSNAKHQVMFRLMYASGLRRNELCNLLQTDIETKDGKFRIRINKGKGGKDRYTVLSKTVVKELRTYYLSCRPKKYLFNGRTKSVPMSHAALRHALLGAIKRSGITKPVNMHILRHCFASHALEDGMNIKTLQYLLGHSSVHTTMIYLHVSEVPLSKAFSPLDNW